MHILAYVYHWDRNTLWTLPYKERKMWVNEIYKQKEAEAKSIEKGSKVRR